MREERAISLERLRESCVEEVALCLGHVGSGGEGALTRDHLDGESCLRVGSLVGMKKRKQVDLERYRKENHCYTFLFFCKRKKRYVDVHHCTILSISLRVITILFFLSCFKFSIRKISPLCSSRGARKQKACFFPVPPGACFHVCHLAMSPLLISLVCAVLLLHTGILCAYYL